jgi:tight adherence protein B
MEGLTPRDLWYALSLAGIFVAILLAMSAAYTLLLEPARKRRQVAQRLMDTSDEYVRRVQIIKARLDDKKNWKASLLNFIFGRHRIVNLQKRMLQADIYREPASFLGVVFLLAGAGFLAGLLFLKSFFLGLLIALPLGLAPFLYLRRQRTKKALTIEAQMPDAMELLARSLRAGHTLPSAVELLGDELEHPLGTEMKIAYEEQRFGLSMPDALNNMLDRVDSRDLHYFVTAVLIQSETGGNLVEVVQKIGALIRQRLNFKAKIRSLTAQGRMSAIILTLLPVVLFFAIMALNPKYQMSLLQTSTGRVMLLIGVFMVGLGGLMMQKLIKAVET